MPRFVTRLILIPLGFTLGATAGILIFIIGAMARADADSLSAVAARAFAFFGLFFLAAPDDAGALAKWMLLAFSLFAAAPLAIVALVGEIAGLSNMLAYVVATGAAYLAVGLVIGGVPADGTSILPLAAAASGLCSGFVYWLVAGRGAGRS